MIASSRLFEALVWPHPPVLMVSTLPLSCSRLILWSWPPTVNSTQRISSISFLSIYFIVFVQGNYAVSNQYLKESFHGAVQVSFKYFLICYVGDDVYHFYSILIHNESYFYFLRLKHYRRNFCDWKFLSTRTVILLFLILRFSRILLTFLWNGATSTQSCIVIKSKWWVINGRHKKRWQI